MIEWKQLERNGEIYKERWPFRNGVKALSPSSILEPIAWLIYGTEQVKHDGMLANSKIELAITTFLRTWNWNVAFKQLQGSPDWAYQKCKIVFPYLTMIFKETARKKEGLIFNTHTIYFDDFNGTFIACETDIDFKSSIWEIKMSKIPTDKKKAFYLDVLIWMQCYIQHLCSKKSVSLLHLNSRKDLNSSRFKYSPDDLLKFLIDLKNSDYDQNNKMYLLDREMSKYYE